MDCIMECLGDFCNRSGQIVSKTKTKIFCSKNTFMGLKRNLSEISSLVYVRIYANIWECLCFMEELL